MGRRFAFLPSLSRFMQSCITEFIGTYFLVLIVASAVAHASMSTFNYAPLAIGFGLAMLIYSYGYISKAQFNPAVSLGLFVAGIQDLKVSLIFIGVQVVAGILGALTAAGIMVNTDLFPALMPYEESTIADVRTFFAEMIFTFNLAHTMINVAVSRQGGNSHFGLAIGMAVLAGGYAIGSVSGGSLNPAVTTALQLTQLINKNFAGRRPISYIWLYWLAELLGGVLAGIVFHLLDEEMQVEPESIEHYGTLDLHPTVTRQRLNTTIDAVEPGALDSDPPTKRW
jgi:glycerol uptake facilitator-like aquaporin